MAMCSFVYEERPELTDSLNCTRAGGSDRAVQTKVAHSQERD